MNHQTIETDLIVERYLAGRLPPDEEAAFEAHYLACPVCLDQLELAEAFETGIKQVVAEDAATVDIDVEDSRRVTRFSARARAARPRYRGLLALAAVAAVTLIFGFLARQLASEKAQRTQLAAELGDALSPQANPLVLPLSVLRGGSAQGPAARLRLSDQPRWIVLALELERPEHERYRAVLVDSDGETLWSAGDLVPNHLDALTVGLHSSFLAAGDYTFRVEAETPDAGAVPVATFAFRVESGEGAGAQRLVTETR